MPIQLLKEIAKGTVRFKLAECRVIKCCIPIQLLKEIAKGTVRFKLAECHDIKCRIPIQLLKEIAKGTVRFKLAECCVIKCRIPIQLLKEIAKGTVRFKLVEMSRYQVSHADANTKRNQKEQSNLRLLKCRVIKCGVLMQILEALRIKISKETERFKLVKMLLYQVLHYILTCQNCHLKLSK
jgi:hypothetical protein